MRFRFQNFRAVSNESFLNHQIAHNVIFVFVEKELCISAFERLKKSMKATYL